MRFQLLAARLALAALVLAAAIAVAAVAGVRLELFPYLSGLTLMVPAVAMGLIALTCALAWMFTALKRNQGEGKRIGFAALIGALLFLWVPLHTVYVGFITAPINDVTSDPEDPPQFVALAKRGPGMNSPVFDNSRTINFRGESGPPSYMLHLFYYDWLTHPHAALGVTTAKWFWRNFEAVKRTGWHVVAYDDKTGLIEATTASFWFGQVTDIVIRVKPSGAMGARMDLRAQSESGDKDFGHNLALVKNYLRTLNP